MKKILLVLTGLFIFSSLSFAQDRYALVEVLIRNEQGTAFVMNTVTKLADRKACEKILAPINLLKDQYQVRTDCVSGREWDKLFANTFASQPAGTLYIAYQDPLGNPVRVYTKVLTGADYPEPGRPVDLPEKDLVLWANAMIKTLEKGGIKNARIIYPKGRQ